MWDYKNDPGSQDTLQSDLVGKWQLFCDFENFL